MSEPCPPSGLPKARWHAENAASWLVAAAEPAKINNAVSSKNCERMGVTQLVAALAALPDQGEARRALWVHYALKEPPPKLRPLERRTCYVCDRAESRGLLRVIFRPDGYAAAVCDGDMERIQGEGGQWAFCYLPRSVSS